MNYLFHRKAARLGYVLALAGPPLIFWLRMNVFTHASMGGFGLFILPIALGAMLGGVVSGMLATCLSIVFGALVSNSLGAPADTTALLMAVFAWGIVVLVCGFFRSIIARLQKANQAQQSSQGRLISLVNSLGIATAQVDTEGVVIACNPAFADWFGKDFHQVIGHPFGSLDAGFRHLLAQESGEQPVARNGQQYTIKVRSDEYGRTVTIDDISEREALAKKHASLLELERQARLEAEELARSKDNLLRTISHELRTPLTTILGWTEIIKSGSQMDILEFGIAAIDTAAKRQAELIGSMLDVARLSQGRVKLNEEFCTLQELLDDAVKKVNNKAEAKLLVADRLYAKEPIWVCADCEWLEKAVISLLNNARKFSKEGEGVILRVGASGGKAYLEVEDRGVGFEKAFEAQLYDLFSQQDAFINRSKMGLGLGLTIAQKIVDLHGGTLEGSSPGKNLGATFRIELKQAKEDANRLGPATAGNGNSSITGYRILLVDDDSGIIERVGQFLMRQGAAVSAANSAAEALQRLDTQEFDLIITDIGMPDMDGIEFANRIKLDQKSSAPIIAMTAYELADIKDLGASDTFDKILHKPLSMSSVMAVVKQVATEG